MHCNLNQVYIYIYVYTYVMKINNIYIYKDNSTVEAAIFFWLSQNTTHAGHPRGYIQGST